MNDYYLRFGRVTSGLENVYNFYSEYGDMPPWGKGPVQPKIQAGSQYIEENFPYLDKFNTCTIQRYAGNENNQSPFVQVPSSTQEEEGSNRMVQDTRELRIDNTATIKHPLLRMQQLLLKKNESITRLTMSGVIIMIVVFVIMCLIPKKSAQKTN
jgi:hypothetical protein